MMLVEDNVGAVEAVDVVESEGVVEAEEEVVGTVRLIVLSTCTSYIFLSHRRYGSS